MDEIFSFGPPKLNLAEALKKTKLKKVDIKPKSKKWSSSTQSDSDEEEDHCKIKHGRKRRKPERGNVAARLKKQAEALEQCLNTTPPPNKEDGDESSDEKDVKNFSLPPSPIPSPPPLVFFTPLEPKQSKTLTTLLKADQMLQELKQPQLSSSVLSESSYMDNSSLLEVSGVSTPSADKTLTLRVRCRGKIHRFTVNKDDPLILLCRDLGKELGVKGEQILLSHRTATLSSTSSPATLELSTVDIIDAIVLLEDQLVNGGQDNASLEPCESITLKVQTSKKSVVYNLAKTDTLSKVMTAFAAALELPVNKIKFSFDGDPVLPDQTPIDLDMDNDDIIDARLLTS